MGPGRHNEHTDQHVITASSDLDVPDPHLSAGSADEQALAWQLDEFMTLSRNSPKAGHVYHISLSNPADDRRLTDQEWSRAAHEVVDSLKLSETADRAGVRWVAVRHGLSTAGNDHIHIAVVLVRSDGRIPSTHNDFETLDRACVRLESTLGLVHDRTPGRKAGRVAEPSRADQEISARSGQEPLKVALERRVRAAATAAGTEVEFLDTLTASGLLVRPRWRQGEVTGYSVADPAARHAVDKRSGEEGPIYFAGGSLATDLALPALRASWSSGDPSAGGGAAVGPAVDPAVLRDRWERAAQGQPASGRPAVAANAEQGRVELTARVAAIADGTQSEAEFAYALFQAGLQPEPVEDWGERKGAFYGYVAGYTVEIPVAAGADGAPGMLRLDGADLGPGLSLDELRRLRWGCGWGSEGDGTASWKRPVSPESLPAPSDPRHGGAEPIQRVSLAEAVRRTEAAVRGAAEVADNEAQFVWLMRTAGLAIHVRRGTDGQADGYVVADRTLTVRQGSRGGQWEGLAWLGGDRRPVPGALQLTALRARWEAGKDPIAARAAAEDVWSDRGFVWRQENVTAYDASDRWASATAAAGELRGVLEHLQAVRPGDAAGWARAAAPAAGALAAAAEAMGPTNGASLARAARELARQSQHRAGNTTGQIATLARAIAAPLVLGGAIQHGSAVVQGALLAHELNGLVTALVRARVAMNEARDARALLTAEVGIHTLAVAAHHQALAALAATRTSIGAVGAAGPDSTESSASAEPGTPGEPGTPAEPARPAGPAGAGTTTQQERGDAMPEADNPEDELIRSGTQGLATAAQAARRGVEAGQEILRRRAADQRDQVTRLRSQRRLMHTADQQLWRPATNRAWVAAAEPDAIFAAWAAAQAWRSQPDGAKALGRIETNIKAAYPGDTTIETALADGNPAVVQQALINGATGRAAAEKRAAAAAAAYIAADTADSSSTTSGRTPSAVGEDGEVGTDLATAARDAALAGGPDKVRRTREKQREAAARGEIKPSRKPRRTPTHRAPEPPGRDRGNDGNQR
jgi:hypothetical protein